MEQILSPAGLRVLDEFARSSVVLAFDYEGTLAPIGGPMRPETRPLFSRVARLFPTIVFAGLARDEAIRLLNEPDLRSVFGNHGVEDGATPPENEEQIIHDVMSWRASLEERLAGLPGVRIESTRYWVSAQHRVGPNASVARAAIDAAVASLGTRGLRVIAEPDLVRLFPAGMPPKNAAFERTRAALGSARAIYVGDDATDEDVFAVCDRASTLCVRVGANPASTAPFFLPGQREIDVFLRALAEARR